MRELTADWRDVHAWVYSRTQETTS
jgi:hypothetical protein